MGDRTCRSYGAVKLAQTLARAQPALLYSRRATRQNEDSMKKAKSELNDWGQPEYERSDLGELVRGKYAKRIRESTNIIVFDPVRRRERKKK